MASDPQERGSLEPADVEAVLASTSNAWSIVEGELRGDGGQDKAEILEDFWRQATARSPAALCKLGLLGLPGDRDPPATDAEGRVSRDALLAWLSPEMPAGDLPGLLRPALLTRASALLGARHRSAPGTVLSAAWPGSDAALTEADLAGRRLLSAVPAAPRAGAHLLAVVRAGLDANAVPFPRLGRTARNPEPAAPPAPGSGAGLDPERPFELPFGCEGAPAGAASAHPSCCAGAEGGSPSGRTAAAVRAWRAGHARHVRELRAGFHEGRPLDLELAPWPVAERGAVAEDRITEAQAAVLALRAARGPLPPGGLARRRKRLAVRLGSRLNWGGRSGAPLDASFEANPRAFVEVMPELEREASLEAARARRAADRRAAAEAHERLAEEGARFAAWPEEGSRRWPVDRAFQRHAKWFAMWRARPRRAGAEAAGSPPSLRRSDSAASLESWLSVSEISWVEVESRAGEHGWEALLDEYEPQLRTARAGLDTLSKADIVELKALGSPPVGVTLVMEAVCVLLGAKAVSKRRDGVAFKDYWEASKALLGDAEFLRTLLCLDYVPRARLDAVAPYLARPDFEPERVKASSRAAAGLCGWVRATFQYQTLLHAAWDAQRRELAARPREELLAAAARALDGVGPADVEALRSLAAAPPEVQRLLAAALGLLAGAAEPAADLAQGGGAVAPWAACRAALADPAAVLAALRALPAAVAAGGVPQGALARARARPFLVEPMRRHGALPAALAEWLPPTLAYCDAAAPAPAPGAPRARAGAPAPGPSVGALAAPDLGDLQELKSLPKPPHGVDQACAAVQHLLAGLGRVQAAESGLGAPAEACAWKGSQRLLGDPALLSSALSAVPRQIDGGELPAGNVLKARQCLHALGAAGTAGAMARKSKAAAGLVAWAQAALEYYDRRRPGAAAAELAARATRLGLAGGAAALRPQAAELEAMLAAERAAAGGAAAPQLREAQEALAGLAKAAAEEAAEQALAEQTAAAGA